MQRENSEMEVNLLRLKVELLCNGGKLSAKIDKGRKAGAGLAGGRYIVLPGGSCVNTAFWGNFAEESPWELAERNGTRLLMRKSEETVEEVPIEVVPHPNFYSKTTSDGTPMWKVALLHGTNCLATTVYQKCDYWKFGKRCKFCGIELSLKSRATIPVKRPRQFREVVEAAAEEGVCNHITLTTGTTASPDRGSMLLAEVVREVKSHRNIPIHVQVEPPEGDRHLDMLADVGVDTIGIHIETFDREILNEVCPGKAETMPEKYFEAWKRSIELFGEEQVSSFIIAGLGESDESILRGAEELARMGVIPYLVPLRSIVGTEFENKRPPSPKRMIPLYKQVAETLRTYGLNPIRNKAGCVRCGACSAIRESMFF
ncbi:MAG: MSMEG_0568 family radical SAM protein [Candidatus Bathyarchaeota archaeon]|nr:MSMEG_0568 family radical SAM protein [Candidatus Bathyarchaeota archaeon]